MKFTTISLVLLSVLVFVLLGLRSVGDVLGLDTSVVDLGERAGRLGLVALLWGVTNPWMEVGAKSRDGVGEKTEEWGDTLSSMSSWGFLAPYIANQAGSVLNVVLLGTYPTHIVGPITNALTVVVTALSSSAFGIREAVNSTKGVLGLFFVVLGAGLCNLA